MIRQSLFSGDNNNNNNNNNNNVNNLSVLDHLHETSKPIFWENNKKHQQFVACSLKYMSYPFFQKIGFGSSCNWFVVLHVFLWENNNKKNIRIFWSNEFA